MKLVALFLLASACSSGETFSHEPPMGDAGTDAGEAVCGIHQCFDSFVLCDYCLCPGKVCRHVDDETGEVIAEGICEDDLACSEPCPSPTGLCPP